MGSYNPCINFTVFFTQDIEKNRAYTCRRTLVSCSQSFVVDGILRSIGNIKPGYGLSSTYRAIRGYGQA